MPKKRIVLKKPGEAPQVIEAELQYRCELKQYIGDYVETCPIADSNLVFACDEEGHPKGLPFNCYAETASVTFPVQMLVGNIVFTRIKQPVNPYDELYDYEIESLTDEEIDFINKVVLSDENQKECGECFRNRYKSMSKYTSPVVISFGEK